MALQPPHEEYRTNLSGKAYGVVGQRGFFDHFDITFRLPANEIEIVRARVAR